MLQERRRDGCRAAARGARDRLHLRYRGGDCLPQLGDAGAGVVVTGRDEERGRAVVGEVTGAGGEAIFVGHDLEDTGG